MLVLSRGESIGSAHVGPLSWTTNTFLIHIDTTFQKYNAFNQANVHFSHISGSIPII